MMEWDIGYVEFVLFDEMQQRSRGPSEYLKFNFIFVI